ncbi:hypothetical protein EDEG_00623 [Edhazardia aedis USNM 41457]|uniref:Uncharacterized protein n=1 Tax=Edhazardia aedis (strain USNM 41457) TaxID=1003232 RepID=J9DRW8_EDHAE|nr:hypothetical protein EDEG_00623 [Edhazardia aedis USNM 41457]|eukprot:EJW05320.1 hypothetical protein EDEG_00623 [Edhazardia aedis USNM 41457]
MATKSANKKHRFSKKSKNKEDESFSGKKTLRSVAISSKRSSDVFSASQEVKEPRVNEIECRDALIDYFNQKSYDWESKAEQFEKKEVEYMMRKNGKRVSGICGIRKGLSDGSVGNSLKSSLGIDDSVVIRKDNESSFMESSLRERCKSLDTSATKIHQISIRNSNKRHSINNVDDESEYNSKASKGNLKEEAQKVAILRTPQKNRKKKEDGLVESFKKSLDEKAISKDNLKSVKAEKYPRKVEKEKNKKSVEANKKNSDANTRIQDDESNVKLEKSLEKVVKERKKNY